MKFKERLLFFLIIVVLAIGLTVPVYAGHKNKHHGKVTKVKGNWEMPISNGLWQFEDDGGYMESGQEFFYEKPDGTTVFTDEVGIAKITGDLEGYHLMIFSTFAYPESSDEKWEVFVKTRLHATVTKGKLEGKDIDALGNQIFEIWHQQYDESGAMPMTGSGKYTRPFNPRFCSPIVFLKYDGWMNEGVEGTPPTAGTYEGVVIDYCR